MYSKVAAGRMRTLIVTLGLLVLISIGLGAAPSFSVRAASIADSSPVLTGANSNTNNSNNNGNSNNNTQTNSNTGPVLAAAGAAVNANERLGTTGSTDQPTKPSGPENIILQIVPKKSIGVIGRPLDISIAAKHENGTGIPGVKIIAQIGNNADESVKLGGSTDKKGILIVTPIIGQHAQPGQFAISATAIKEGFTTAQVMSGFAVDAPKGSSGSSGGSSGK